MDRLGHQKRSRRDKATRISSRSIGHTVGVRGNPSARKVAITTE
jgi:hypothetical protein